MNWTAIAVSCTVFAGKVRHFRPSNVSNEGLPTCNVAGNTNGHSRGSIAADRGVHAIS